MVAVNEHREVRSPSRAKLKPPIPLQRAISRTDIMLDQCSSDPVKSGVAKTTSAKFDNAVAILTTRIDEKKAANEDVDGLERKRDFIEDLADYIQRLTATFDRQKKSFNIEKANIQVELETKLKVPVYVSAIKKALPYLGSIAAGGAVVATGIWNWVVVHAKSISDQIKPETIQSALTAVGGGILVTISIILGRMSQKRLERMNHTYAAKKELIDKDEDKLRQKVLRLAELEYFRLAKENGFELGRAAEPDPKEAYGIVSELYERYGKVFPLREPFQPVEETIVGRWDACVNWMKSLLPHPDKRVHPASPESTEGKKES